MNVVIGIDPHKASHTAVAIDEDEDELSSESSGLSAPSGPADRLGRALRQAHLGHRVPRRDGVSACPASWPAARWCRVPATLASGIRVLATERSNKNDPNDAHSIAVAALRAPRLRAVEEADHSEVLRLLAKRNIDIGNQRTRLVWSAAVGRGEYVHIVTGGILEIEAASVVVDAILLLAPGVSPVGKAAFCDAVEDGVKFRLGD